MDLKILDLIYEIKNSSPLKELNEELNLKNIELEKDESVIKLVIEKDKAISEYDFCLKTYGEDDEKTKESMKKMYLAIKNMNSHRKVKEYNDVYLKYSLLMNELEKEIFTF